MPDWKNRPESSGRFFIVLEVERALRLLVSQIIGLGYTKPSADLAEETVFR